MIDYETYVQIRNFVTRDHLKYSQIADKMGLDQRTVAIWANENRYRARKTTPRTSKLDPFKDQIIQMLEINAGFDGIEVTGNFIVGDNLSPGHDESLALLLKHADVKKNQKVRCIYHR